ncbi:MAG: response regulator transcription factor [Candidatus Koribacter versatilis]|uniref:Response regulator transcription factor n=1 Tax=Candidatus Korobacter versatilis TaxID=658062 RepID=A0A932A8E2_9BACT|nr:response regulator transcription factor [Candidatus Koribacter versatilis]
MSAVLVVEDEKHLADGLRFNLEAEGFQVTIAPDGEKALQLLGKNGGKSAAFAAVLLDVMLPGINGFGVAAELRKRGHLLPILMLTARGSSEDVLRGFESGADDYLPKPFELSILIARLQALLRRHEWAHRAASADKAPRRKDDVFRFDGKKIDFAALELETGRETIPLTQMEAQLLRYLVTHAGEIVSRKAILHDVWDLAEDTDTRAIDNFIVRLRKYIEKVPARPKYLQTVRGVGYRFVIK